MLSLLDHTRERLASHPERQAGGRGDPRADQRSHGGVWNIHREYAEGDDGGIELKTNGNVAV